MSVDKVNVSIPILKGPNEKSFFGALRKFVTHPEFTIPFTLEAFDVINVRINGVTTEGIRGLWVFKGISNHPKFNGRFKGYYSPSGRHGSITFEA